MASEADGFRRILETLDRMEIAYLVGGSVASSHGIGRATQDVDLIADIRQSQLQDFSQELQSDFYADPDMMKDALRHGAFVQHHSFRHVVQVRHFPAATRRVQPGSISTAEI
jgi:hypothetical protein